MLEEILEMYFDKHMKQKDIAKFFNVSNQYISKVVRKDERYYQEKQKRHQEAKRRKAEYNKQYFETYERKIDKSDREDYEILQAQLDNDSRLMSKHSFKISNDSYVQSNLGAYTQDKKGNLVVDGNINTSYALPKKYKRNVKRLYQEQIRP